MDLLGAAPTHVVPRRGTRALQASAALATMLVVTGAGSWPFAGGAAVERLVVSASAAAPELPASVLSADDRREPLVPGPHAAAGLPVSTTTATALVVVDGPSADPAGTERAFAAYRAAADRVARTQPGCRLSWALLAGIGLVESGHGTVFGGHLDTGGKATPPILGPRLDGNGFALITDTDGGVFDGDTELDRATGPMQFIPGTWARWGSDGDGDGVADPQDVDDAALAAGRYLCASGGRLDVPAGLISAVFSYNHSYDYVRLVLTVTARYLGVEPSALGVDRLPAPAPSPAEPAPGGQPPPGEPPPAEPAPGEPAPAEPAPGEPAPAEPTPGEPTPGEPTPTPTPGDPPPPGQPAPGPDQPPTPAPCPTVPTDPPGDPTCPPSTAAPAAPGRSAGATG